MPAPPAIRPPARSTGPVRLAVLVSGSGTNLQAILDASGTGRLPAEVALVVSNRRAAFALERAAAAGVPSAYLALKPLLESGRTRRDYDAALAEMVAAVDPDWVVLAGWMHVLSSAFLDRFEGRVVNLHPALPGACPGGRAIDDAWAAYGRGEIDRTGVMVHLVPDEGVDEGPVLGQREVPIRPDDTRATLESRIHRTEHELLVATLTRLIGEHAEGHDGDGRGDHRDARQDRDHRDQDRRPRADGRGRLAPVPDPNARLPEAAP
jgi:phosphoribosylglycinamide formyltransferase-1